MLRALLREPLLHFLVLGGLLFGLFGLTRAPEQEGARQIRVTTAQVEQLAAQFRRTWMRPPTEQELAGLVERHIRSEVFYREALAMGLDQEDPYVRNRLGQKLELLLDDLSAETVPDDETLAHYLREHPERYQAPARVSFQQVYLSPERHPRLEADAADLLARLLAGADPAGLGDVTLLGPTFDDLSQPEVARQFGDGLRRGLAGAGAGAMARAGPLRSRCPSSAADRPAKRPAASPRRGPAPGAARLAGSAAPGAEGAGLRADSASATRSSSSPPDSPQTLTSTASPGSVADAR